MEGNQERNATHANTSVVVSDISPALDETMPIKVTKLICYTLVFVIGVLGNAMVFRLVLRRRKLQTVSNYLICNLAAADIAVLTVNLPFRLAYQENAYVWPFGSFTCKIIPMLTYLFITASSITLVIMSMDQHRAVVYPLMKRLTITQTKIVMVIVWVVSAVITLPLNFSLQLIYRRGKPVCTDVWPSLRFEQVYFVVLFFLQYLLPMSVITSFYAHVCMKLDTSTAGIALAQSLVQRERRNKKVIKMLIVIVSVNALLTLPYHVTWLFSVFGYPHSLAKKFCVLLVIATSAAHPIIYGTLNKDFARGFRSYAVYLKCIREHAMTYRVSVRRHSRTRKISAPLTTNNSTDPAINCIEKSKKRSTSSLTKKQELLVVDEYETCL